MIARGVRRVAACVVMAVALVTVGGLSSVFAQAGGLVALPPSAPGPNLVKNGSFETGTPTGPEHWRLVPTGAVWSTAEPGRTGKASLRLTGADVAERVPSADQTVTLETGYYTLEGWARVAGLGAESDRTGVRLCLDGRPRINWWHCTPIHRGTTDWTRLERQAIPVESPGAYRITVGAYGRPPGQAWFDDIAVRRVQYPPLDVYLLYPNYRGLIFDDRAQTVRVSLGVDPGAAPRGTIHVVLVEEGTGTVRTRHTYAASAAQGQRLVAEVDASPLPHGDYVLHVALLDGAEREIYRHPGYRLVRAPASDRRKMTVWVDERNVTYLHGRPSFVLGLYTTSGYATSRAAYAQGPDGWGIARMSEAPVNMLINYHLGAAPVPALTTYMDELRSRGIYYLQTVNFYYEDHPQYGTVPYPAARDGEDALNRWVGRTLAAHPGLAGFYTADERPAEMIPPVFRQYREFRRAAPGTVAYAVLGDGWERQAPLWRDAVDVLGLDPYPITKPRGENHLAMVGEWTRLGRDAVMDSRPVWMVLQYFPLTRTAGWPTREELRAMSWMAIVDGARGLFYWSYGARGLAWVRPPAERRERWEDLVTVTKEIKALEPVLLAPDAPVLTGDSSNGSIRTLGKLMPDGVRYLFAYNSTNAPVTVTWTFAEPAGSLEALDAGTPAPPVEGRTVTTTFRPYEVQRYRLK